MVHSVSGDPLKDVAVRMVRLGSPERCARTEIVADLWNAELYASRTLSSRSRRADLRGSSHPTLPANSCVSPRGAVIRPNYGRHAAQPHRERSKFEPFAA